MMKESELSRKEILRISIEMDPRDPSKTETIVMCEGDEPRVKAQEFAEKHGIGKNGAIALENTILANLENLGIHYSRR